MKYLLLILLLSFAQKPAPQMRFGDLYIGMSKADFLNTFKNRPIPVGGIDEHRISADLLNSVSFLSGTDSATGLFRVEEKNPAKLLFMAGSGVEFFVAKPGFEVYYSPNYSIGKTNFKCLLVLFSQDRIKQIVLRGKGDFFSFLSDKIPSLVASNKVDTVDCVDQLSKNRQALLLHTKSAEWEDDNAVILYLSINGADNLCNTINLSQLTVRANAPVK